MIYIPEGHRPEGNVNHVETNSQIVQAFCEMTSHKLQQKQTQLILFPKGILIARKKVLRNPLGGRS